MAIIAKRLPVPSDMLTIKPVMEQSREWRAEKEQWGSPNAQEKYPGHDVAKSPTPKHDSVSVLSVYIPAVIEPGSHKDSAEVPKSDVSNISLIIRQSEENDELQDSSRGDRKEARLWSDTKFQIATVIEEVILVDRNEVALISNKYPELETRGAAE